MSSAIATFQEHPIHPAIMFATDEYSNDGSSQTATPPAAISPATSPKTDAPPSKRSHDESFGAENPKVKTNGKVEGRSIKRRAAQACQNCRRRKVRCNVTETAPDGCHNCKYDGIECVLQESRRRSFKKESPRSEDAPQLDNVEEAIRSIFNTNAADGPTNFLDLQSLSKGVPQARLSVSDSSSEHGSDSHVPHALYQRHGQRTSIGPLAQGETMPGASAMEAKLRSSSIFHQASLYGDLTAAGFRTPPPALPPQPKEYTLPAYIAPLPKRISESAADYLFANGALSIPHTDLRDKLLQRYVEFVHPFLPLLNLSQFLRVVNQGANAMDQMSLLLFQAVMFSATAYVDEQDMIEAGYSCHKSARKAFFQKARLLHDFDYEANPITNIQALLLMTYWYDAPNGEKDTWHWMGIAISSAYTIGLNRNPAENSRVSLPTQRLWKRIWWSCVLRDRLIALGMRRVTRIKDEDFNVPMLTVDDFEIEDPTPYIDIVSDGCPVSRDAQAQRELAEMCIAQAKLCVCTSHVLSAQYSVSFRSEDTPMVNGNSTLRMVLSPKDLDSKRDEVDRCDKELNEWLENLPGSCKYLAPPSSELDSIGPTKAVQRALLHMAYYTTVSALHRPLIRSNSTQSPEVQSQQNTSKQKVKDVAAGTTKIISDLHDCQIDHYLPTTGVTFVLPAIVEHLTDIKSSNESTRMTGLKGFWKCVKVLGRLRPIYPSADVVSQFLDEAIKKANIRLVTDEEGQPGLASDADQDGRVDGRQPVLTRVDEIVNAGASCGIYMRGRDARITPPPDNGNLVEKDVDVAMGGQGMGLVSSHPTPPENGEAVLMRTDSFLDAGCSDSLMAELLREATAQGDEMAGGINIDDFFDFEGRHTGFEWDGKMSLDAFVA